MMLEDGTPRNSPIVFLTVVLSTTCVVLILLGWTMWNSYEESKSTKERYSKIEELRGIIIHLDEVLTMSARMAAATGDLRWEKRYRSFEPKLDTAIKEAMGIAPEAYGSEAAAQTDTANIKLVTMENQAFDLVHQGRVDEASGILFGDAYERQKLIYSQGMTQFAAGLSKIISAGMKRELHHALLYISAAILLIPLLLISLLFLFRAVRKWHVSLTSSNRILSEQSKELADLNKSLDVKVVERTEELEEANNKLEIEILRHKQAGDALRESENRFRDIAHSMADWIWEVDKDGKYTYFSDTVKNTLGYSPKELIGKTPFDLMPAGEKAKIKEIFLEIFSKSGPIVDLENWNLAKDGTEVCFLTNGVPIFDADSELQGYRGVDKDITNQKKLEAEKITIEAQLQQSQKMEAVGTLAGGIAHDFNNILAIILGNAELASDDVPDWNPASKSLKEIHKASIRAKDMVRQLLAFSRKSDEENKPLNMAPIIKESMKMLRSAVPTSVEFEQHISGDPCNILGDAAQINQIVMNLVINAADAMSKEGGLLEVTLDNIILQKEKPCLNGVLSPGAYVRLGMRDTGDGIDPEIMDRIFDPYFTTKEVGKGTGMGLSVVQGIVKRHGSGIRVESELGKGTLFEIYFPALEETAEEEKEPQGEIKGGSERILFVDDEESMVELNRQRLERLGYDVKSTTKPLKALEWFKADPDQFDVIITDMTMPRMTGDRLTIEVLKIRPHMPVIICTGYSERMSAKKAEALGVRKYIEKPIELQNLAVALREVLDEK